MSGELLRLKFGPDIPALASISGIARRLNTTTDRLRRAIARGEIVPDGLTDSEVLFRVERLETIRETLNRRRLRPVA